VSLLLDASLPAVGVLSAEKTCPNGTRALLEMVAGLLAPERASP
jgi:hypothetical protein